MFFRKVDVTNRTLMPNRRNITGMVLGVLLVTSVFTLAGFAFIPSASATFPGESGKIAFTRAIATSTTSTSPYKIYTINPDGTDMSRLTDNDFTERQPLWSPDGSKIVFSGHDSGSPGSTLYVINSDGTGQMNLTASGAFGGYEWSPDGTKIAYFSGIPNFSTRQDDDISDINVVNADGTGTVKLTDTDAHISDMNWSPDSSRIAYVLRCEVLPSFSCPNDVYIANADGGENINLTQFDDDESAITWTLAWSPDGTRIAFDHFLDSGLSTEKIIIDIHVVNADASGGITNLTNNTAGETSTEPQWSLDGEKLVFTQGFAYTDESHVLHMDSMIAVMNSDGSNKANLTGEDLYSRYPQFSPDGTKVLFSGTNLTSSPGILSDDDYYVMNGDGSEKVNVTKKSRMEQMPAGPVWSPDSTKVAFTLYPIKAYTIADFVYVANADGAGKTRLTGGDEDAVEFEADWGVLQELPRSQAKLDVEATDLSGNSVSGIWTTIRTLDGTLVQTGYTPFTFIGESGMQYKITVTNYGGKEFVKWHDDESASRTRTIGLSSNTTLTAVYDTGDALRGFTSLTYTSTEEQPDLTVNATTLDGNKTLHMWAIIDPQSSDTNSTTYRVYATNGYQNLRFDHWEDGSTNRVRTLSIEESATITAYYKTG